LAKSFRCKLVTPSAALLDDTVRYASVPAHDGLMGIEAGHAPMLVKLGLGELRLDMADDAKLGKGGSRSFVMNGGTLKVSDNEVIILAEQAVPAEEINAADAEAELRKVTDSLKTASKPELVAQARSQQAFVQKKLAMARAGKGI
jgi:F-type H+-transporting ATPase subunit epsilon